MAARRCHCVRLPSVYCDARLHRSFKTMIYHYDSDTSLTSLRAYDGLGCSSVVISTKLKRLFSRGKNSHNRNAGILLFPVSFFLSFFFFFQKIQNDTARTNIARNKSHQKGNVQRVSLLMYHIIRWYSIRRSALIQQERIFSTLLVIRLETTRSSWHVVAARGRFRLNRLDGSRWSSRKIRDWNYVYVSRTPFRALAVFQGWNRVDERRIHFKLVGRNGEKKRKRGKREREERKKRRERRKKKRKERSNDTSGTQFVFCHTAGGCCISNATENLSRCLKALARVLSVAILLEQSCLAKC